ncbi:MAG TPA: aldehyde dehydrogenase family protein [Candidatus Polarisedimenticolaceae bacterium]
MESRPFLVAGRPRDAVEAFEVRSPWDEAIVARVARPGPGDVEDALREAHGAREAMRRLPAWRRAEILANVARRLEDEPDRWAETVVRESGKPWTAARGEVDRAASTLRASAAEATRDPGEIVPLDAAPGGEGRLGILRRFPLGVVACITPFNFPLNLVAHKIGPAVAAGCPFVLKPASKTPSSALDLAQAFVDAGTPPGAVSVLPLAGEAATALATDARVRVLSFTGSPEVGWDLKRRAVRQRVVLELGGNAGVMVDRGADLERAAARCVAGAFGQAGQSCVSVQRIYVHRDAFEPFLERLLARVRTLVVGDPMRPETQVGPLVTLSDARRVAAWIDEARASGARVLAGGSRRGAIVEPTVITGTRPELRICAREVFGPVAVVEPVGSAAEGIAAVDASEFGLQAGIFTPDLATALEAYESIEAGAVLVNEVPTWRSDPMPYGGTKGSGVGREGPRWAIEDYTEPRLLVLNR